MNSILVILLLSGLSGVARTIVLDAKTSDTRSKRGVTNG
ncbi:MAG: hypothetical protein ACI9T9_002205 [Oleiphilaceae bacterium]|jgi:hypothetical protein